jgi:hypothetical protein
VFENDLVELDAAQTLAAAEANERTHPDHRRKPAASTSPRIGRIDIRATLWVESRLPGTEPPVQLGGDGTPTVVDFAAAELGCVLRISDGSASRLIADALDLRHRLPRTWAAAQAGQGAGLPIRPAGSPLLSGTSPSSRLHGWMPGLAPSSGRCRGDGCRPCWRQPATKADPAGTEHQASAAAQERFVRLGRPRSRG